ncbi:MAG: HAD-IC family P-type ATPase [Chloroflexi bacterium]|nr:HAD-IC family P-type ATPase [Chloroflexota bacterium]
MPSIQGLSSSEAAARRARGEGNTVSFQHTRSYAQIVRENVFTFINNVLYVLGIALILLGRVSDAVVSVGVVSVNIIVSVVQEIRAKRTLDRISLLTRPHASVVRDGQEQTLDPSEVVLGDALRVGAGDQIVVDGVVLDGRMDVDESLLTGESDLVPKQPGDEVFSGSFCVSGTAYYEARRVGAQSMANQITAGARAFRRVLTPLQREVNLVIRVLVLVVAYFEILLMTSAYVNGIPLVDSVRMSVVLAGLVPNGLFLAIAVAYSLGAVRIARQGALVQQANAIESLSNVDVLCMDKTGTLTANRIQLESIHALGGTPEPELRQLLADYAASTAGGNRTNEALAAAGSGQARRVRTDVPFSSARKWSALAFDDGSGAYVLGAPEMIRDQLAAGPADWTAIAEDGTAQGLRVLLFARAPAGEPLQDASGEPRLPSGLAPLGIVRFSDELRAEARETLAKFRQTGVQLKIISGDNPQTVAALARQAGFDAGTHMISGPEMDTLDEAQFAQAAEDAMIFGRVTPQHKERLVQALKKRGHYVAMIGDGVNDVLSLKQSNLGIAMQSGSQATRSVADIILLNDSFASLPAALMEGQRIINGMQDILKIFLTRVLYVSLLFLSTGLVRGFPFGPKESSLLALFTVGIPTVALAIWARPGMRRNRNRNLMRSLVHFVIPAAATISLAALGVYIAVLKAHLGPGALADPAAMDNAQLIAQTALTTVSVLCGLMLLVFVEPPTLFWTGGDVYSGDWRPTILAGILLVAFLGVMLTPLRDQFELARLEFADFTLIAGVVLIWGALVRWAWRNLWLERFLSEES